MSATTIPLTRDRSAEREVRNPVLRLPAAHALATLPPDARDALRTVLGDLAAQAKVEADRSWRTCKPPMAAYWSAVKVYAKHIRHAIPAGRSTPSPAIPVSVETLRLVQAAAIHCEYAPERQHAGHLAAPLNELSVRIQQALTSGGAAAQDGAE